MASASSIKAGEAYVRMFLDSKDAERGLKNIQSKLRGFASMTAKIGATFGVLGGVGVAALTKTAMVANEVELTARRLEAVFGDAAEEARKFSRILAKEIGDSRFQVEATLVTFKSFFAEIVNSETDQKRFSQNMVKLSRDFAAFQNLTNQDATQRFISALSGSPEVLDRFGINLKAAAINAELAANGIEETTATATEFQKVIARMAIIERTMGKQGAIGKAQLELSKFSGQLRAAKNATFDFLAAVGAGLLPAVKPLLSAFVELTRTMTKMFEVVPGLSVLFGVLAVGAVLVGAALVGISVALTATAAVIGSVVILMKTYSAMSARMAAANKAVTVSVMGVNLSLGHTQQKLLTTTKWFTQYTNTTTVATAATTRMGLALGFVARMVPLVALLGVALTGTPEAFIAVSVGAAVAAIALKIYSKRANQSAAASLKMAGSNLIASASFKKLALAASTVGKPLVFAAKSFALLSAKGLIYATGFTVIAAAAVMAANEFGFFGLVAQRTQSEVTRAMREIRKSAVGVFGSEFVKAAEKNLSGVGKAAKVISKNYKDGIGVVRDFWATVTGGETARQKATKKAKAAQKMNAAEQLDLDRKLEDARIAGIERRADRELAVARAKNQREIQDEIAKNTELNNLRNRQSQELQKLRDKDGVERSEIQALKAKQAAEFNLAVENNNRLQVLRATAAQRIANIEMEQARRASEYRISMIRRAARARVSAAHDGLMQELALMDIRFTREQEEAKRLGRDLSALRKAQAAEWDAVLRRADKERADVTKRLMQELQDTRINNIKDEEKRSIAAATVEYERRRKLMQEQMREALILSVRLGDSLITQLRKRQQFEQQLNLLKENNEKRLAGIRKRFQDERLKREKEEAKARQDAIDDVQKTIDQLRIEVQNPDGLQKQLKLIELRRREEIKEAGGDQKLIDKINERFDLEKKLAEQRDKEDRLSQATQGGQALGSFSGQQIAAFTGGDPGERQKERELLERQLDKQKRTNELLERIEKKQGAQ